MNEPFAGEVARKTSLSLKAMFVRGLLLWKG
jgi:hypothetical protein